MTDFFKRNSLWFLLIFIALAIYFLPIKVPSDINSLGKVYSSKHYILHTGNDGQVRESLINLSTGVNEAFTTREVERGDDIRLKIRADIFDKEFISRHDTIAQIYSYQTELELNTLVNDLEVINAQLLVEESGNKPEDIELARKRREYAKIDAEIQEKIYQRQKYLYENEVIADQDFEDQERTIELKKMQIAINDAELRSLESGAKPEQIKYIKAQIRKLQSNISDLQKKLRNQTITSPVNGIFRNSYSPDTLLVIEDIDNLIIKIPVMIEDMQNVFIGQKIICKADGRKEIVEAEVTHIRKNVKIIDGRQVIIITGRFLEENPKISPGVVVRGKLERDPILLKNFIANYFNKFFGR
jgi:hypothetical protein